MRTLGLVGGMSWESTAEYYRILNREVRARLGGQHSAPLVLYSVDFASIERLQREGRWEQAGDLLVEAALRVERAGAELLLLCTNTMHKLADRIEDALGIPFVHIADATAAEILRRGLERVGLLGTRFTMEQEFYRGRLRDRFGIEVLIPGPDARERVHAVIYDELCVGEVRDASRQALLTVIEGLAARGAQAVVLGCTELPLLIRPEDTLLPVLDTTRIHARRALDLALADAAR